MSWQDYVDNQLLASQCVTKACIAGHDGNIWAQSNGFERRVCICECVCMREVGHRDTPFAFVVLATEQHQAKLCKYVTKEELAKLISGFDQQDLLTSNGVTLAGQRYIYLSGTDRVVRAKLGRSGVHCMKTTQGEFCT
ncbi:hypothetical protein KR093_007172 [Drosophila rubida]|uniref:Profilin n=1 Tax=Drosophila rubida TaxID=30044 RepID=A0AAD4K7Z1_9MUSC|nr:hypothetical protein KR093_007172 [Drosophila rubida]